MKLSTMLLCGGLAFALAGSGVAGSAVNVYGKASYNDRTLVLNVFADSTVQLRSFGIKVGFDSSRVLLLSVAGNDALWFLAAKPGMRSVYSPSQVGQDSVRIVGARFEGNQPSHGVSGSEFLLASLTFERMSVDLPSFQLALAGPVNYASFVTTDGTNMDGSVSGLGTLALSFEAYPEDSDGDGIPDPVELAWFGTLTRANASTDSDGDGVKDIDEWIAGTNAADPNSATRLVLTVQPDGSRSLSWDGQPGRVYDLLWSSDLTAFSPIAEGLTPAVPNSIFDTIPANIGFYSLRVHLDH